jgi:hypothetical protein
VRKDPPPDIRNVHSAFARVLETFSIGRRDCPGAVTGRVGGH